MPFPPGHKKMVSHFATSIPTALLQVAKNGQKTKMSLCVVFVQDVQASCIPNISVQPYFTLKICSTLRIDGCMMSLTSASTPSECLHLRTLPTESLLPPECGAFPFLSSLFLHLKCQTMSSKRWKFKALVTRAVGV